MLIFLWFVLFWRHVVFEGSQNNWKLIDAIIEVESVVLLIGLDHSHLQLDSFKQFLCDFHEALWWKFGKMILDDFCCYFPNKWNLRCGYFMDECLQENLIEVIVNQIAEKIKSAVSGSWVHSIGKGKTDPVFTLTGNFVHFIVIICQKSENSWHLDRWKWFDALVAKDHFQRLYFWLVVSNSIWKDW